MNNPDKATAITSKKIAVILGLIESFNIPTGVVQHIKHELWDLKNSIVKAYEGDNDGRLV